VNQNQGREGPSIPLPKKKINLENIGDAALILVGTELGMA